MDNVRFRYLYRDGSNYKRWGDIVFSNPDQLSCELVKNQLKGALGNSDLFIAHQVRIPETFLWNEYSVDSDDHCFHEFSEVEVTSDPPSDEHARSIQVFLDEVASNSLHGWLAFEPTDRFFP